jgi:hypothetical protein
MLDTLPLVSKLKDGRLLWLAREEPKVLIDGSWIPAVGVTFGSATESKPLSDDEIRDLMSKGMLPK